MLCAMRTSSAARVGSKWPKLTPRIARQSVAIKRSRRLTRLAGVITLPAHAGGRSPLLVHQDRSTELPPIRRTPGPRSRMSATGAWWMFRSRLVSSSGSIDRPTAPSANFVPGCVGATVRVMPCAALLVDPDRLTARGLCRPERSEITIRARTNTGGDTNHRVRRVRWGVGCMSRVDRAI